MHIGLMLLLTAQSVATLSEGLSFVAVGAPGNPPCPLTKQGAVSYAFEMGACEITNSQYAAFLNAVAAVDDPYKLYSPNMANGLFGGIGRSGENGRFRYAALEGYEELPVVYVSWYDAARFCNWLHYGCPAPGRPGPGVTEGDAATGAYDTSGFGTGPDGIPLKHNPQARYWLPTVDEWIKAAYYDPARRTRDGYWLYPVRSDTKPACVAPPGTPQAANYFDGRWAAPEPFLTPAGAYVQAKSPWGTFDQGGNVLEWLETPRDRDRRWLLGGDATKFDYALRSDYADAELPDLEIYIVGFRVARAQETQ